MQHKMKILAALIVGSLSLNSFAEQQVLNGTFRTIKAVTILPITGMSFTGLTLTSGDDCDLETSTDGTGTGYLGDVFMRLGSGNNNAIGSTANKMTSCVGAGTPAMGVYEIDGASGGAVTVTITNGTNANVAVIPSGCVGNYGAGEDLDTCKQLDVLTTAGVTTIRLAGSTDTGSLGEGTPIEGTSLIALGGNIAATSNLTAGSPYTVDFTISVTY